MTIGRLILAPADPQAVLPSAQVLAQLQRLELCGDMLPGRADQYAVGEAFMQWISFAGCSPFIRYEPESAEDEAFCHLRLWQAEGERPGFFSGPNSKPPSCPHCGKALTEWQAMMSRWQQGGEMGNCRHCSTALDPLQLNWRRHAGLGKTLVAIYNIFPGEARPLTALLERLGEIDESGPWIYFYG